MDKFKKLDELWQEAEDADDRLLADTINEVIKFRAEYGCDSHKEQLKETLGNIYEKSTAYTNLVIIAGYASAFTIWQLTKHHMTLDQSMIVGSLLVLSVSLFVAFEVYKMISNTFHLDKLGMIVTKYFDNSELQEAWSIAINANKTRSLRVWKYFLVPTVISAVLAAIFILWIFLENIVR